MKKQVMIVILTFLLTGIFTGCGITKESPARDGMAQQESSGQTQETTNKTQDTSASAKEDIEKDVHDKNTEPFDRNAATEDENVESYTSLEEYALLLNLGMLSYTDISYVRRQEDDMLFFMSEGLEKSDGVKAGTLDYEIFDFDKDGENELVTIDLSEHPTKWSLEVSVYEYKDEQIKKKDTGTLFENLFSAGIDSGDVRLLLKDEKYLIMDASQLSFLSADGIGYKIKAYSYNGESLIRMAEYEIAGSDFYETGKNATELVDQLNTMGLSKSAASVYDRDTFRICMADEGLKALSKIQIMHSYLTTDKTHQYDPWASVEYIEGLEDVTAFVFPDSHIEKLTEADFVDKTVQELRIARNEIYARYGWSYQDEKLANLFQQRAWYAPSENVADEILTEVERYNVQLISEMEKKVKEKKDGENLQNVTALSKQDLEAFQEYFNAVENNGFLSSRFKDVRDVNLHEVFYNGAGLTFDGDVDAVVDYYLHTYGEEELQTDLTIIRKDDIQSFLKAKTGLNLAAFNCHFSYLYVPNQAVYAQCHGDTNYCAYDVLEGYVCEDGETYIIYARSQWEETDSHTIKVTLKKNAQDYMLVSVESSRDN